MIDASVKKGFALSLCLINMQIRLATLFNLEDKHTQYCQFVVI